MSFGIIALVWIAVAWVFLLLSRVIRQPIQEEDAEIARYAAALWPFTMVIFASMFLLIWLPEKIGDAIRKWRRGAN